MYQDLRLWILEPFGTGFTTPNFGSTLVDLIGSSDDYNVLATYISAEINRVLGLYQRWQYERLQAMARLNQMSLWSGEEILDFWDDPQIEFELDRAIVMTRVYTLAGPEVLLGVRVDESGVSFAN